MSYKVNNEAYSKLPGYINKEFFDRSGVWPNHVTYHNDDHTRQLVFTMTIKVGNQLMAIRYSLSHEEAAVLSNEYIIKSVVDRSYNGYVAEIDKMADEFMREGE